MRTLEQKISDAGPNNQRIDPHVLTSVRNAMVNDGRIDELRPHGAPWYFLTSANEKFVQDRLAELNAIHRRIDQGGIKKRIGQAMEIAVYRALKEANATGAAAFLGDFPDLDDHDDSTLYSQEEPRNFSGRRAPGDKRVDFIAIVDGLGAAVEVKNIREWIYPDRSEVRELILKSLAMDIVPVLIARRIHFSAFSVLNRCGVILHQTYNQLYPASEALLAADAMNKTKLGFHDIRTGNVPDARLIKFVRDNLPSVVRAAREKFDTYRDLLESYVTGEIGYVEFSGRSKRRSLGQDEDGIPSWEQPDFDEPT